MVNIGTYLQAYALARIAENKNVDVEYVNYIRPRSRWIWKSYSAWKKHGGWARGAAAAVYGLFVDLISLRRCKGFLESRVRLSKRYFSIEQLRKDPPIADLYLTGSDQVWNPVHNDGMDRAFFLNYGSEKALRFAYAASIGLDSIPEEFKADMVAMLGKYSLIATREHTAQQLLKAAGIENVVTVLDPTMLFDREMWRGVAAEDQFVKKERYLLVYSVENELLPVVSETSARIAERLGLKIYFVTPRWFASSVKSHRRFYFATPPRFLSLFLNADFAVVSSFHGTAFSLNLNVPFVSITPNQFNVRVRDLLEHFGLENRLVRNAHAAIHVCDQSIDWDRLNEQLQKERAQSVIYIEQIVQA